MSQPKKGFPSSNYSSWNERKTFSLLLVPQCDFTTCSDQGQRTSTWVILRSAYGNEVKEPALLLFFSS